MVYSDKKFIGKKLREYRRKLHYTQEQVAEKIDIDANHYGKIERGIFYPSVCTFLNLLELLKIPIKEFGIGMTKNTNATSEALIQTILTSNENENKLFLSILNSIKEAKIK